MPAAINTVGQSFTPAKQGGTSTSLSIQNTINSSVQPNNAYLLANVVLPVTLTSGPPLAFTPLSWNLVSDSIKLNYLPTFTEITLYRGVWETQVLLTFGDSSDGQLLRISVNEPSNLTNPLFTQMGPENVGMLFGQKIAIQDPTITKSTPYTLSAIGVYYESRTWGTGATNAGDTVPIIAGQLLITRVG